MREDGRLFRFNALWIGDDGRVRQLFERRRPPARAPALSDRRPRPDADPRPDRRPRPCHGPRHGRAAARPFRHQQPRRRRRRGSRLMPPPTRPRAGSSGAAGTRSAGGSAASRPPPISTPPSPTGRSGWSGSTAMPAGPTAWRCARPISPPPPRRRRAAGSSGPGATPRGIFVDAAMSLVERAVPPPVAEPARPGACPGAGNLALLRPHQRRRHGHERRGLGGDAPRRRRRPAAASASSPTPRASTICSPSPARGRRPGSMTGGCAWSA